MKYSIIMTKVGFFLSRTVFFKGGDILGDIPTVLQEIDLSILSNDDCSQFSDFHGTLPNIMVCGRNHEGSPCMVRVCDFGYDFHFSITALFCYFTILKFPKYFSFS